MRRNLILGLIALVLGASAAYVALGYLRGARAAIVAENEPVEVLVVKKDAPQGLSAEEMVSRGYVELEAVPGRFVPGDALSSIRPVENQVLAVPVSAGEQLTEGRFTFAEEAGLSYTVPEDLVALSMEADDVSGVSGLLRPGDNVIVFASFKPEGGLNAARTETLIPKARVLAVGSSVSAVAEEIAAESDGGVLGARASSAAYSTVTLALRPEDAARVVFARQNGSLQLALIPQTAPDGPAPRAIVFGRATTGSARPVTE